MTRVLDSAQKAQVPFPSSITEADSLESDASARNLSGDSNKGSNDAVVNRSKRTALDVVPSAQRISKVYSSTTEAIANFKPTPRQVISGIAPHVFDERKRRRSQSFRRPSKAPWYGTSAEKRSSPLRGATVITWDEHSIYLEQPPADHKCSSVDIATANNEISSKGHSRDPECPGQERTTTLVNSRRVKSDKTGWKYLRVDVHLLKTLVVKLKLTSSSSANSRKSRQSATILS